jgi:hypothetical protein
VSDLIAAQRDRLLDVLEAVMVHLTATGGSPAEHQAFADAFAELAEHGRGLTARQRERYEIAHAEWEARRK